MTCWACHTAHDAHYVTPREAAERCCVTEAEVYIWIRKEQVRVTSPRVYAGSYLRVDLACAHVQTKLQAARKKRNKK